MPNKTKLIKSSGILPEFLLFSKKSISLVTFKGWAKVPLTKQRFLKINGRVRTPSAPLTFVRITFVNAVNKIEIVTNGNFKKR